MNKLLTSMIVGLALTAGFNAFPVSESAQQNIKVIADLLQQEAKIAQKVTVENLQNEEKVSVYANLFKLNSARLSSAIEKTINDLTNINQEEVKQVVAQLGLNSPSTSTYTELNELLLNIKKEYAIVAHILNVDDETPILTLPLVELEKLKSKIMPLQYSTESTIKRIYPIFEELIDIGIKEETNSNLTFDERLMKKIQSQQEEINELKKINEQRKR